MRGIHIVCNVLRNLVEEHRDKALILWIKSTLIPKTTWWILLRPLFNVFSMLTIATRGQSDWSIAVFMNIHSLLGNPKRGKRKINIHDLPGRRRRDHNILRFEITVDYPPIGNSGDASQCWNVLCWIRKVKSWEGKEETREFFGDLKRFGIWFFGKGVILWRRVAWILVFQLSKRVSFNVL